MKSCRHTSKENISEFQVPWLTSKYIFPVIPLKTFFGTAEFLNLLHKVYRNSDITESMFCPSFKPLFPVVGYCQIPIKYIVVCD